MTNLNLGFRILREQLEERLKINLHQNFEGYNAVIPLRDVVEIEHVALFRQEVLEELIKNIPLRNNENAIFPYAEAKIENYGVEPKGLMVGQTFALEGKILSIMWNMGKVFENYVMKGISKMPPVQVYGKDADGQKVMAFYIPPIVERHDNRDILLDGIHRSMICSSAGTTICPIYISKVLSPLPFEPISWKKIRIVKEKPPIQERYVNLQPLLFRDLGYVGIDG